MLILRCRKRVLFSPTRNKRKTLTTSSFSCPHKLPSDSTDYELHNQQTKTIATLQQASLDNMSTFRTIFDRLSRRDRQDDGEHAEPLNPFSGRGRTLREPEKDSPRLEGRHGNDSRHHRGSETHGRRQRPERATRRGTSRPDDFHADDGRRLRERSRERYETPRRTFYDGEDFRHELCTRSPPRHGCRPSPSYEEEEEEDEENLDDLADMINRMWEEMSRRRGHRSTREAASHGERSSHRRREHHHSHSPSAPHHRAYSSLRRSSEERTPFFPSERGHRLRDSSPTSHHRIAIDGDGFGDIVNGLELDLRRLLRSPAPEHNHRPQRSHTPPRARYLVNFDHLPHELHGFFDSLPERPRALGRDSYLFTEDDYLDDDDGSLEASLGPNQLGSPPQRLRVVGHDGHVFDLGDYLADDDEISEFVHPPSTQPASSSAINSLPTKQITEADKGEDGKASCSICMEEVPVGTTVTNMPCGHWFHFECIKAWLEENGTCPLCRTAYGTDGAAD